MNLSNEFALILECTQLRPIPETEARTNALIGRGIRWERVLRSAIPHGVLPLIAHSLSKYADGSTPEATLGQLRSLVERVRKRNESQCEELNRAVRGLMAAGINVLAFKGPTLARLAYGDIGLRESHDLDLWTDPRDIARTGDTLLQLGYRAVITKNQRVVELQNPSKQHTWFASANGEVNIELQDIELAAHFRPVFAELWERRQVVNLGNAGVPTLGTEDLLLALCVHGSKHIWRRLSWVVDIAGVVEQVPRLDWVQMQELAVRWRARRRLLCGLALAARLYGSPLPDSMSARVEEDGYASAFVAAYLGRILPGNGRGNRRPEAGKWDAVAASFRDTLHHCRSADRGFDRIRVSAREIGRRSRWIAERVWDAVG